MQSKYFSETHLRERKVGNGVWTVDRKPISFFPWKFVIFEQQLKKGEFNEILFENIHVDIDVEDGEARFYAIMHFALHTE